MSALVTPNSGMTRRIAAGSTSRNSTFEAPLYSPTTPQPLPAMWNSGITTRLMLCSSKLHSIVPVGIIEKKFSLVSSTPFGRPVVPDV